MCTVMTPQSSTLSCVRIAPADTQGMYHRGTIQASARNQLLQHTGVLGARDGQALRSDVLLALYSHVSCYLSP